jgi:HD-GYP domain-containing protein (c-di-GMP phosphodiesterase class II)
MFDEPREALESIKHLMAAINTGAALIDRAGRIVHVNARMCAMSRRPFGELVGADLLSFYNEAEDRAVVEKSLSQFELDSECEFFLTLPDGAKLPIITSARPLPGKPPLSDHRLLTIIDISRQKEAEQSFKQQYDLVVQMSDTVLQQAVELKRYSQELEERVRQRTAQLHEANMDAIYMLAVASEAKDVDTGRHVRRIEQFCRNLAKRMGYTPADAEKLGHSAILHDVGKIHIPDEILTKPGPLDARERARMQLHTLAGERILTSNPFFEQARRIARNHHENWDGSGYPDGLGGDEIPIEPRIVHVTDVFDALTHDRVYKKAGPIDRALHSLREGAGTLFDPQIVHLFATGIESGDIPSLPA